MSAGPPRRAAFGLGANLGDRLTALRGAVEALAATPGLAVAGVSSVYETAPVGGPAGQPPYLNAVLVADTALSPRALLERALAVEAAFGRRRTVRWGPRTLDVDVLAVGECVLDEEGLQVPHPRIAVRPFVVVPWAEADPDAVVPGVGAIADLAAEADRSGIRRVDDAVLPHPASSPTARYAPPKPPPPAEPPPR